MAKKRKQFSPHIFAEWGELFDCLTAEQNSEILIAIAKYPNYEPKCDIPVWNFIKSQIQKDYDDFIDKCNQNKQIAKNYWAKKNANGCERIPNETECMPKRITNNDITNNEITNKTKKPTEKEVKDYLASLCKKIDNIKEFIAYYDACNWLDSNGFNINWKQKAISWANKQKEKQVEDTSELPYNAYR